MTGETTAQTDYVEASAHDMRRSRQVNADMVKKLGKQEEENKVEQKKRLSRPDMKHRQSMLLTSFAPMRPIIATKEMMTQTESEPLKTYGTIETQTE